MTTVLTASLLSLAGSAPTGADGPRAFESSSSSVSADSGWSSSRRHAVTQSGAVSIPTGRTTGKAAPDCPPNTKRSGKGCIPKGSAFVVYGERCKSARKAAVYYRALTWERQEARGGELADRTPIVKGKTCRWARYAASEHRARAKAALRTLERWMRERTLRDFAVTPGNDAWLRAVEEAQRAYPDTAWWLKSCSASEGGWGRWVPNSQGSGVGGWMQMYPSTFWRMWSAAREDLRRRGFRVPKSAASWYSPLGQALASAWGLTNGRRHEWHGAGC